MHRHTYIPTHLLHKHIYTRKEMHTHKISPTSFLFGLQIKKYPLYKDQNLYNYGNEWETLHLLHHRSNSIVMKWLSINVWSVEPAIRKSLLYKVQSKFYSTLLHKVQYCSNIAKMGCYSRDGSRLMERGGQNELRLSGLVQNEFQKRLQPVRMVVHLTKLSIYH